MIAGCNFGAHGAVLGGRGLTRGSRYSGGPLQTMWAASGTALASLVVAGNDFTSRTSTPAADGSAT